MWSDTRLDSLRKQPSKISRNAANEIARLQEENAQLRTKIDGMTDKIGELRKAAVAAIHRVDHVLIELGVDCKDIIR